eukprot:5361591-Pleurochrysis_carterae.AAC.1
MTEHDIRTGKAREPYLARWAAKTVLAFTVVYNQASGRSNASSTVQKHLIRSERTSEILVCEHLTLYKLRGEETSA